MNDAQWIFHDSDDRTRALAEALAIPVKIAQILVNRDISDEGQAHSFLFGTLADLHDPFLMRGMQPAVERLLRAASRGERVLIFGDYDVDGVLSVVILSRALEDLGARVDYYIPDRLEEGYGLKLHLIRIAEERRADVVVSVDCGIKALPFVRAASDRGIDVIITDHHQPGDQIPPALAVLNPALEQSGYPDRSLAGIGVVFKLIQALYKGHTKESQIPHYLKLVSIGTVADIVSLKRENRLLVKYGLQALDQVANLGLASLLEVCRLNGKSVRVSDVAFRIGPRINAAGRMGKADLAVRLFFSDSVEECQWLAGELDALNTSRQEIEKRIYLQAGDRIQAGSLHHKYKLLVLGCDSWHRGVIGIVASKLKDEFHRPILLFSYQDGRAHGSGRSIREFSLIDCLTHAQSHFSSFGGHPMAVGCEIPVSELPDLKKQLNAYAEERISASDLKPKVRIDARLNFDEIDSEFMDYHGRLSPFGVGNPRPVFVTEDVEVVANPRRLKERHIKLLLRNRGRYFDAVGWGKAEWMEALSKGSRIHTVYSLQVSQYLGGERLSLILEDIRPA